MAYICSKFNYSDAIRQVTTFLKNFFNIIRGDVSIEYPTLIELPNEKSYINAVLAAGVAAAGNAAGRVTSAVAPGIYLVRTPAGTVKTAVR